PLVALAGVGAPAAAAQALRSGTRGWTRPALAAGLGLGLLWTVAADARAWPHGLCYVNELWGGSTAGYRLVSDSNYDWGQGVPELAAWQRERGAGPMDVWYFGRDPALDTLAIRHVPLHDLPIGGPEDLLGHARHR